jgi:hypothetical protein
MSEINPLVKANCSLDEEAEGAPKHTTTTLLVALVVGVLCGYVIKSFEAGAAPPAAGAAPPAAGANKQSGGVASWGTCNQATEHGFLMFPAAVDCSTVYLSHGGEFECPHQFELKLLARFDSPSAQQSFCHLWKKQSGARGSNKVFIISAPLPAYAKDKLRAGTIVNMQTDVFHGLADGVAGTNPVLKAISLSVDRVIYMEDYGLRLKPSALTYILHSASTSGTAGVNKQGQLLAHQVTSPPDFDHLLYGQVRYTTKGEAGAVPPAPAPRLLTFPGKTNDASHGLRPGRVSYAAVLHEVSATTGELVAKAVVVEGLEEVYKGVGDDGFVIFDRYCKVASRPTWTMCAAA